MYNMLQEFEKELLEISYFIVVIACKENIGKKYAHLKWSRWLLLITPCHQHAHCFLTTLCIRLAFTM